MKAYEPGIVANCYSCVLVSASTSPCFNNLTRGLHLGHISYREFKSEQNSWCKKMSNKSLSFSLILCWLCCQHCQTWRIRVPCFLEVADAECPEKKSWNLKRCHRRGGRRWMGHTSKAPLILSTTKWRISFHARWWNVDLMWYYGISRLTDRVVFI